MKTLLITATIFTVALSFSSCNNSNNLYDSELIEEKSALLSFDECTDSIFTTTAADLTDTDIAGLQLMREEEKMAHDVYVYFFEKYEIKTFERVSFSETKHALAVLRLLNHFELEDPTLDERGTFANTELQNLHNELILAGDVSAEEALMASALIEETDIKDLQRLIEETENADIILVYSKLLKGSYMHLKAFTRLLSTYDITYTPQLLSQEEYDAITVLSNGKQKGKHGENNNSGNKKDKEGKKDKGSKKGSKGKKGGN